MSELATQNLLAGTGRLAGAFILLFMMGAGLAIGTQLSQNLFPAHTTGTLVPLPAWVIWPAIAALGISMLGSVAGAACLRSRDGWRQPAGVDGVFAGRRHARQRRRRLCRSARCGQHSHLYTYLTGQSNLLVKIPGLITLVPGSMGFRGLHALMEQDSAGGVSLITTMVLTGAVLAVGLLLADNIVPLLFTRRGTQQAPAR